MVVQAWSFLISRNQLLDYRTIVAPHFMSEMNLSGKLSTIVVDEEQTEEGYVHYCEIHSAKFGDLSLVYRTLKANGKDIDLDSNSILTDRGGREISSVEGIVLRSRTPNILLTNYTFEEIHKSLMFTYKVFWSLSEFICPYSSVPFELKLDQPDEGSLKLIHHNPYILDAPKNSLCAKWILVKEKLKFDDCKLISATFSPDGKQIAVHFIEKGMISLTSCVSCVIYCNLSESSTPVIRIFKGNQGLNLCENSYLNLSSAIFSPDGRFIAFSAIQSPKGIDLANHRMDIFDHNVIKIYELQQQKILTINVNSSSEFGRVLTIAFTPDSQIIAGAGADKRIRFWDILKQQEILTEFDFALRRGVQAISFSPNAQILVAGDFDGLIKFWNWKEKQEITSFEEDDFSVKSLAFSPDGQKLVVGGSNRYGGTIKIYNVKNDKTIIKIYDISTSEWGIYSIGFSSHSEIFASGSSDGEVKIWDTEKGELLHTLWDEGKIGVRSVAFNPNGDTLIAAMEQDKVYVWDREEESQ